MAARGRFQQGVEGQRLQRDARYGARGQAVIEVAQAIARGLADRVETGAIDQFEKILLIGRKRHRPPVVYANRVCAGLPTPTHAANMRLSY